MENDAAIKYELSLIIPCYNEALNIPHLLERCAVLLNTDNVEVILVNNGSTDNTVDVLTDLLPNYSRCRSINVVKNVGYGHGIMTGLRAARGKLLAWTHADMQTDPKDVLEGLKLFKECGDNIFIKGRRYGRPFADVVFTVGMSAFETLLLKKALWDINAQPTMFSRDFFATWQDVPDDFSLDLYAYYSAKKMGLKVLRFPVLFSSRMHGMSSWNINWSAKRKFISRTVEFSLRLKNGLLSR